MGRALRRSPWDPDPAATELWDRTAREQLAWLREHPEGLAALVPPTEARAVVLLIEPRADPRIEFVLRAWAHVLGTAAPRKWGLVVAHGTENVEHVRDIVSSFRAPAALLNVGVADLKGRYNGLLTDDAFWAKIPNENILLVQTDTLPLGARGLGAKGDWGFTQFDYVGAPWWARCPLSGFPFVPWDAHPAVYEPAFVPEGHAMRELAPHYVGNGGLSFRKRSAMIACCERFVLAQVREAAERGPPHPRREALLAREPLLVAVGGGRPQAPVTNEDVFFAVACKRMGLKVPSRDAAVHFAVEAVAPLTLDPDGGPLAAGLHRCYSYMDAGTLGILLRSSVIARAMRSPRPPLPDDDGGGGAPSPRRTRAGVSPRTKKARGKRKS